MCKLRFFYKKKSNGFSIITDLNMLDIDYVRPSLHFVNIRLGNGMVLCFFTTLPRGVLIEAQSLASH